MIIQSFKIKRGDEKRLIAISGRSDYRNNTRRATLLEIQFLMKEHLAIFDIKYLQQLINTMAGSVERVIADKFYIIHYEACHHIKSFKLITTDFTIIQTFNTETKHIKTELIRDWITWQD